MEKLKSDEVIPMKYDGMFCELFNNKKNICILEEFIADYFGYKLEDVRGNLTIEDRKLKKRDYKGNRREVDLLLNYQNELKNIEISTGWNQGIRDRNVIFLADIHSSQTYENYQDITQTVQINLLAFNYRNKFKSSLYLCDPEDGYIITKKLRLDIINMEIGKDLCYTGEEETDKLIKWSKAFMSKSYKEVEEVLETTLTKKSKDILLSDIRRLSGDEKMVKEYREKSKHELEHESFIYEHNEIMKDLKKQKEVLNKQIEEAKKQSEEAKKQKKELNNEKEKLDSIIKNKEHIKNIEIAKKMLEDNIHINDIVKYTNLSKEEIENLL